MSWLESIGGAIQAVASVAVSKAAERAPGFDGVPNYAGFISSGERNRKLQGSQRWTTLAATRRRMPVSIATQLRASLFAGVTWTLKPNPAGGELAQRGVDLVQRGLLDARFVGGRTWSDIVARAADGRYFLGHSVHALAMGRMHSGQIGYVDIAHRPQHTIERWLREVDNDETTPIVAVEQRATTSGQTIKLALSECFYVANNASTDDPRGHAMLDDVAERYERVTNYEQLEARELFSSMGGTPIARAPTSAMYTNAAGTDEQKAAEVDRKTWALRDLVMNRIKHPDKYEWLMLDSATYQGADPNTISSVPKWDLQIVKGDLQGAAEMRTIIRDLDLDIARMLGVEYVLVGGGDTAGTFGMHASKISMLGASLSAESLVLARAGDAQLVRRLVAANGLDSDLAAPTLVPSPVVEDDVLLATQALVQLNASGLAPDDPAREAIMRRLDLPYRAPKAPSLTLPSFGAPRPPAPTPGDVLGDPTPEQAAAQARKRAAP